MDERNGIPEEELQRQDPGTAAQYAAPEIEDDDPDDAPTEWVPSRFEKRIHAIPEGRWTLYQIAGGIAIGAFTSFALFAGGAGVNALFLIAIALALLFPKWLEDRGRRSLNKGRLAMVAVIAAGLVGMVVYNGLTRGWSFFAEKEAAALTDAFFRM